MVFSWPVAGAVFLASGVEFVEALTVVLAVGVTRGFRTALAGAAVALAALAALVLLFGHALVTVFPAAWFRLILGALLLLVGLKWWKKAVLRAAGRKSQRDEAAVYAREVARLEGRRPGGGLDAEGFLTSFNGVFVEGVEVVVIVLTIGAAARSLGSAVLGALIGFLLALLVGILLRRPLTQVPENALKFVVGVVLTSFGTLILGEGVFGAWPIGDAAILVCLAVYTLASVVFVRRLAEPREGRA